ncbi:MAG: DMT family transporter [Alphaproteobacteria bacterium]|nr:DMT family transporter [Rhodospirillales bacterium]MCW9046247.1 DMT family transporter [Alphaproteobacteria bacterium]
MGVMFLWALCFPLIAMGINDAPHIAFAALRALTSGAALLVLALVTGQSLKISMKDLVVVAGIGLGATTLAFFGMFHAAEFVSPGLATVIASSQPLMAAILAHLFLGEHLRPRGKIGLSLGFLGIVLISLPQMSLKSGPAFEAGLGYIIVAALGITVSNVLIKRIATSIEPLVAMGWQLIIGSIPLAVVAFATEEVSKIHWSTNFLISLIGLSLGGTSLVYWAWQKILQNTELTYANTFTFLVPIFGLAMGILFYGEQISGLVLLGVLSTLVGIFQFVRPLKP